MPVPLCHIGLAILLYTRMRTKEVKLLAQGGTAGT